MALSLLNPGMAPALESQVGRKLAATLFGVAVCAMTWPAPADAQPYHGHGHVVVGVGFGYYYQPYFYDPWFGPWGPWYPYAYGAYPYPSYYAPVADIRLLVTPKNAEVYVDGYYAGVVDEFDGVFQRLHVPPGNHELTLRLDGYRTVHQKLYVSNNQTYKVKYTMQPLGPGETTEPPPQPTGPPPGQSNLPPAHAPEPPRRMPPAYPYPPQPMPPQEPPPPQVVPGQPSGGATLAIRVQPAGAEIVIDGDRWQGPEGDERLLVQVGEGRHLIEIHKDGYRRFTTEIQANRGQTVPLNVALTPERQ